MKRIFIAFALILLSIQVFAQETIAPYKPISTESGSVVKVQDFKIKNQYNYNSFVRKTSTRDGEQWSLLYQTTVSPSGSLSYVEIGYETITEMLEVFNYLSEDATADLKTHPVYIENIYTLSGINLSFGYYIQSNIVVWVMIYNPTGLTYKDAQDYPGCYKSRTPTIIIDLLSSASLKIQELSK